MKYHNGKLVSYRPVTPSSNHDGRSSRDTIAKVGITPYMRKLQDEIAAREGQTVSAEKGEPITMDNHFVAEMIQYLRDKGKRTEERIARDLKTTNKVIHNVGNLLRKAGYVKRDQNKRGSTTYELK